MTKYLQFKTFVFENKIYICKIIEKQKLLWKFLPLDKKIIYGKKRLEICHSSK